MAKKKEEITLFELKTKLTPRAFFELNIRRYILFTLLLLLGLTGIILFIIFYIKTNYNIYLVLIIPFALTFFGAGVLFDFQMLKVQFRAKKHDFYSQYKFHEEYFNSLTYKDNKKIDESMIYYNSFRKYKITENYIFLFVYTKKVIIFSKDEHEAEILKLADINTLNKKIF